MERLKEESDSDVEVLEPEVLQDHYRDQQLRLITALSKCQLQIPKKWEDFQMFVQKVLKFYLSPSLVRSVWIQLQSGHQIKNSFGSTCSVVEISDEEDDKQVVEQDDEDFRNTISGFIEELKPKLKGGSCSNEQLSECVVISDEENTNQSRSEENTNQSHTVIIDISEKCDTSKQILDRSFSVPNGRKRNRNGSRGSLPNSINEEEAEALREKLLLDKIIELEIPLVIKSFIEKNKIKKTFVKKRRKSSANNRESINGTSSDNCISSSETLPDNGISPPETH